MSSSPAPPSSRWPAEKVHKPDHVLVQHLEDESVLLNLETGLYLGLNRTGAEMLRVLDEAPTVASAFDRLLERYSVEPDELRAELDRLLGELLEQGVLEIVAD